MLSEGSWIILSFLVGPVVVGIAILLDTKHRHNQEQSLRQSGYLEENYYTRNEPYQRYEGGDYER